MVDMREEDLKVGQSFYLYGTCYTIYRIYKEKLIEIGSPMVAELYYKGRSYYRYAFTTSLTAIVKDMVAYSVE